MSAVVTVQGYPEPDLLARTVRKTVREPWLGVAQTVVPRPYTFQVSQQPPMEGTSRA